MTTTSDWHLLRVYDHPTLGNDGMIAMPTKKFHTAVPKYICVGNDKQKPVMFLTVQAKCEMRKEEDAIVSGRDYTRIRASYPNGDPQLEIWVRPTSLIKRILIPRRTRYELLAAVLAWATAVVAATVAFLTPKQSGSSTAASLPVWLFAVAFALAALAATAKLLYDISKVDI